MISSIDGVGFEGTVKHDQEFSHGGGEGKFGWFASSTQSSIESTQDWAAATSWPDIMELKFECPTCGQHISATPAQIGVTAPCPNCKAAVTVPNPSALSPSLPPSPQPQSPPAANTATARKAESSVLRILFVLLGIVGLFVSFRRSLDEVLFRFLGAVYILASERRLSRYMYLAEKSRL